MSVLTVGKLIKQLSKMPNSAKVYVAAHDYSMGQGDQAEYAVHMKNVELSEDSESSYIDGSSPSLCGTNSVVIRC